MDNTTLQATVLVIDDDPNGLRLITDMLTSAGYRAVAAYGAEDAWRKLGRQHFDLALVELAMKQVSGIRLIEMLKASSLASLLPILALTTPIRPSLARQIGCDGFVFRPIEPAQLLEAVGHACARRVDPERRALDAGEPSRASAAAKGR